MTADELRAILDEKLQPLWHAVTGMRASLERFAERLDRQEKFVVDEHAKTRSAIGALKESIDARDFRLDDHGRRIHRVEDALEELKTHES